MKREIHKSYAEKLSSYEWREFSDRLKEERGNICQHCGEEAENLQVHHLGYREGIQPWEYRGDEVLVMCDGCHSELHDFADKLWNEVLKCRNMWVIHECHKAVIATLEKHAPPPEDITVEINAPSFRSEV